MDFIYSVFSYVPTIITFFVVFSILVLIHEWGHFYAARKSGVKVEEFGLGLGKKLWGKTINGTEYTLNAIPFGGFVRMLGEEESSDDPRSFEQAALWKRMIIILAGIFMNVVFTIVAFSALFTVGTDPILITKADVEQAEIDGYIQLESIPDSERKGIRILKKVQAPFPASVGLAVQETGRITGAIFQKLAEIPAEIREKGKSESLAGPVGILRVTHKILPSGIWAILKLAALLSLSLAVMNILPIPALDGGRFLFMIFELILKPFGMKMNQKIENAIHMGGFAALLLLLVFITGNDIWSWVSAVF